jgi:hypothetical protein
MDGHPVLTYSYMLYKDGQEDYPGKLIFEQPGKLFSYEADGPQGCPAQKCRK